MAQVDRETLRVIRASEKILIPDQGRTLGNFGICDAAPDETWVVTSEGAPLPGASWQANQIILARIIWEREIAH